MVKKIELSKEELKNIYDLADSGISQGKIAAQTKHSKAFIQKKLLERNSNKLYNENYGCSEKERIIAICKKTNKKIIDFSNSSGAILNHLNTTYDNIKPPTHYVAKSQLIKTGKFWYHDYFEFIVEEKPKLKKCVYCDWTTEDFENKSGAYEKHLKEIHNIDLTNLVKEHPEEHGYFNKTIIFDKEDYITCKICGKKLKYLTNTHLKKHNITILEYKEKYGGITVGNSTKKRLSHSAKITNSKMTYSKTSKNEIKDFLRKNGINIEQSKRTYLDGKEIDMFF
jgi:hypothetical protein